MRAIRRKILLLGRLCMLGFGIFYVFPLLITIAYSFIDSPVRRAFVGLANYARVIGNDYFRLAVKNTLRLAVFTVPLVLMIAALSAYALRGNHAQSLLTFLVLPIFMPSAALAMVFRQFFDPYQGILLFVLPSGLLPMLSLIAFYLWRYLGFFTLLLLSGYRTLSPSITDAALLDGLSPFGAYLRISLPCLRAHLLFCTALSIAYNLRLYREAYILYGAYPDNSIYLLMHYQQNHFAKLNYANLSVSAILLLVPACLLILGALRLDRRWREDLA